MKIKNRKKIKLLFGTFSMMSIIAPLIINGPTIAFRGNLNDGPSQEVKESIITTPNSDFLKNALMPEKLSGISDFNDFKNNDKIITPGTPFDTYNSKVGSNEKYDTSGIRYGGGLIYDIDKNTIVNQPKLNDFSLSTANFISSDTTNVKQEGDYLPTRHYNDDHNSADEIFPSKLDITPEDSVGNELAKKSFIGLFNLELFVWYWTNWKDKIISSMKESKLSTLQELTGNSDSFFQHNKNLIDSPRINLSLTWRQLVENNVVADPIVKAIETGLDIGIGIALAIATDGMSLGAQILIDNLISSLLEFAFPDSYNKYSVENNFINYYSENLDQDFWNDYFNTYLGLPGGSEGPIKTFYENNHEYPTKIEMTNFDLNFTGLNIETHWQQDSNGDNNKSNATMNLSQLALNMNTNFDLIKESIDVDSILNDLKDFTIRLDSRFLDGIDASNVNNGIEINKAIGMSPKFNPIRDDLTFTGDLPSTGKVAIIYAHYKGSAVGIPLKVIVT